MFTLSAVAALVTGLVVLYQLRPALLNLGLGLLALLLAAFALLRTML
jgi:hypothetical protein